MTNYENPSASTLEKWKLVADEYLVNGYNQTKAYCKYYPNADPFHARATASQVFNSPRIKEYVAQRRKEIHESLCIDSQHLADELMKIALSDDEKVRPADKIAAMKVLFQELKKDERAASRSEAPTQLVIRIEDDDDNAD